MKRIKALKSLQASRKVIYLAAAALLLLACTLTVAGLRHPAERAKPGNQIHNHGSGKYIWGLRSTASPLLFNPAIIEAAEFVKTAPVQVSNAFSTPVPIFAAEHKLDPILPQDGASEPKLLALLPQDSGETLDIAGRPLRWQLPGNILSAYSLPMRLPFTRKDLEDDERTQAASRANGISAYKPLVQAYTRKYKLNPSLVMAIIQCESNFRPALVSSRSAMGLMQVMPSTANGEIHRFLYGRNGQMTFADLTTPEINIRFGTAYLHLLFNRYFNNIKDDAVRESCVIASYNLGPNRFLKLYGASNDSAVEAINSMTAEKFHADLPKRLPVQETRSYVEKVKRTKKLYGDSAP